MKKITLFFMLFYASVAAFAQWSIEGSPLSVITDGENVVLKQPEGVTHSNGYYLNSGASAVVADVNPSAIYQFKKVSEKNVGDETFDVFVLLNVKTGKYLKGENSYVENSSDAFTFTARKAVYKTTVGTDWIDYSNAVTKFEEKISDTWVLCSNSSQSYIGFYSNPSIMSYTDTNFWLVYKATKQEGTYIDVTYHYTTTDGFEFTAVEEGCLAPYTPNPSSVAPVFYRVTSFDNTALEADATVEVTCAPDFPMEFTTVDANGFADGTKWYTLYTRGNTANVLYSNGTNLKADGQRSELVANKLFAFERVAGEPYKVRVYCMSEGATRPVRVADFNNNTQAVWEGDGIDVFRLVKNRTGFALANDGNAALDHNMAADKQWMAVWYTSATDEGGQLNAVSADGMIRDLAASANGNFVGGTVGPQALLDAIATYGASSTVANLKTMIDALAGGREERTISADKVYQIVFTRGNVVVSNSAAYAAADGTVSQEADSRHVVSVNPDNVQPVAATLWKFIADEANYKIQSVNSDFYVGAVDPIGLVTTIRNEWGRPFALERGSAYSNVWALKDTQVNAAECYINSYYNPGQNNSHEFCYWNSGVADAGNTVHIVEVTDIPVSITSAGWATLNFPLPLKVHADVKAYYVTEVNADGIYVESIKDVIPAGTPVILSGNEGTYPFEVAASAASVEGNKLVGTTVARKDVTAGTYYGLKAASEGAAFAPYNVTSIPANKALLPASEIPADASAVNALYINFGGSATGIGSASVEQRPAVYYDLNGRIVTYPGKGIYVTADGRKVFLK